MDTTNVTTSPGPTREVFEPSRDNGAGRPTPLPDNVLAPAAPAARRNRKRNWKTLRKRLVWSAAGIVAVLLIVLLLRPTPPAVDTAVIARGSLETTVGAEGVTRVRDRFTIAAPISGRLQRVTLRAGDDVATGALLARITPLPLDSQAAAQARARVAAARAALREAEARVAQTRDAVLQSERSTARLRSVAGAGSITVDAMERAELQLASVRRDHEAAGSRMDAAAAEVAVARAALLGANGGSARAVAVVRSPTGGRVLRVHEQSERVILAGTPLLEVGDAAALEVVVEVLSTDAVQIETGATMRLLEWGGAEPLQARVRLVEPAGFTKVSALGVDEQRVNVVGDVLHAPASVGDGYRVQAQIVTWSGSDVLEVPNSALFRTGSGWTVFVVERGRALRRDVQVGHRGALRTEVLAGVVAGEHVILFPTDRIVHGGRVRATQRAAF